MCSKTKIDDPFPSGSNGKFGSVRREWDLKAKIGLFFFVFGTQCKKGHSETIKLGHSMGRKQSLFAESNYQADSQKSEYNR